MTIDRDNRTRAPRRRTVRRGASAAYTVVEVMMSMAVLAVGVIGIIATEKVTLASNVHAKNLAIATHVAQAWLGMLEAEAALWDNSGSFSRTTWLEQGSGVAAWFRPSYNTALAFGPAFDALGNPVAAQNQATNAHFCVDLRLAPLTSDNSGGGLIRAEVRVIWLRNDNGLGDSSVTNACGVLPASVMNAPQNRLFHYVFMSSAVRQVGA